MKTYQNAQVVLSMDARKTLLDDIYQRRSIEACGVLLGTIDSNGSWHVQQTRPLHNTANSSVYFEFAPEELLEVELTHPGEIIGVYHSHPGGFASASTTDRENMQRVNLEQQIPWIWLIIYGPFNEALLQRADGHIPLASILAYHHYSQEGLQQITVQAEQNFRT
jgi:proteasome lid subunit RPN8/RPN11